MTDSAKATNPPSDMDTSDDAELIALWRQMEPFVEEWNKSVEIADDIERDVRAAIARLPRHLCGEERVEATIREQDEAYRKAGVRHTDDIIEMEVPSLKIMALPAFTPAGLRVKAMLARFNCPHFWDDGKWGELCALKLIESVLDFADRN